MGKATATPRTLDRMPASRSAVAVFLVLLSIYLPTATYSWNQSIDTAHAAISAWTLVQQGTLDLNQAPWIPGGDMAATQQVEVDGRLYTTRFPGVIGAGVPFYAALGPLRPSANAVDPVPAAIAGAVFAAAAMAVLVLVLRHVADPRTALVAALTFGVVSGTWSVSADALWTHAPAQLWLGVGMLATAAGRYGTSGIGWGLALVTRPHLAIVPATVGTWKSIQARQWTPVVATGAVTAIGLAAYLAYGWWLFGEMSLMGGYSGRSLAPDAASPSPWLWATTMAGYLVDPLRGVLFYMPWLVPLTLGLRAAWRESPTWVRSTAVAGVLYLIIQAWLPGRGGGDTFFGPRYVLEPLTLAAPLLLLAYGRVSPRCRRLVHLLLAAGALIHAIGAIFELKT